MAVGVKGEEEEEEVEEEEKEVTLVGVTPSWLRKSDIKTWNCVNFSANA